MRIPRDFPKWDKTVDGLEDAGRWVLDYERSRLPVDLVLPRAGQIWETIKDCEVNFHAQIDLPWPRPNPALGVFKVPWHVEPPEWQSYMRQFGTAVLHSGERVRILSPPEPHPIAISFVPVRYGELHDSLVPAEIRNLPRYHGRYELQVKIARTISDFQKASRKAFFNEDFRLVEDISST